MPATSTYGLRYPATTDSNNVPRDIQNLANDVESTIGSAVFFSVNVKKYGAKGDGVTDDTAAIQAALNAASSGGRVVFPAGTYIISSALTIFSNTILQGSGQFATEIRVANPNSGGTITGGALLKGVDLQCVSVKDITFQGVGKTGSNCIGINFTLSAAANNKHIQLDNIRVYNVAGDGIFIDTPIMTTMNDVRVVSCTGNGISLRVGTSTSLTSCYVGSADQAGYYFKTMTYCILNACASENNGINYLLDASFNCMLNSCGGETSSDKSSSYPGTHYRFLNGGNNSIMSCYARELNNGADPKYYLDYDGEIGTFCIAFRGTSSTNGPTFAYRVANSARIYQWGALFSGAGTLTGTGALSHELTASGTSTLALNRDTTSNFAQVSLRNAGTDEWVIGMRNDSTQNLHVRDPINGRTAIHVKQANPSRVGINNQVAPASTLDIAGSIATAYAGKSADYPVTETDSILTGDATSAQLTFTLPTATGCAGRVYTFKRINGNANSVIIDANGSETIDGALTKTLGSNLAFIQIVSNGSTNWHIIASGGTVT